MKKYLQLKKTAEPRLSNRENRNTTLVFSLPLMALAFLFAGCSKQQLVKETETPGLETNRVSGTSHVLNNYDGLGSQTAWELQQARAATARYRHIKNAIKDGYEDIAVVVQGMGHHFMRMAVVDSIFDIRNPEILVYNRNEDGSFELVAVEYAIPIPLRPDVAPDGFTGTADVWDKNTGFNLWLLHAWVWSFNPDGVFNATNPLVHTH